MSTHVAIVAGVVSGLGQATAPALHAAGLKVVAVDRDEAGPKELPDGMPHEVADATDPTVPGPLVERIATEIGSPDVLVSTIGALEVGDALSVSKERGRASSSMWRPGQASNRWRAMPPTA